MFKRFNIFLSSSIFIFFTHATARTLEIGPGKTYTKPSAVVGLTKDGDTVLIAPGLYTGDVATWSANNLVLRATDKYAHLDAAGKNAAGKGTWVITGNNCKVENIEFSGAAVPDSNGAGIRQEGKNVTIRNCYFHDNENGILTDAGNSNILIEYSEFSNNGFGDGYTHNIYIGNVTSFTLQFCYTHNSKIGHNVKSRALKNSILYNRIMSETEGTTSYEIDFPDGGEAYVIGNSVQHGLKTDNPIMITYGEESLKNPKKEIYIVNNTLVNDRNSTFISVKTGTTTVKVINNLYVGTGTLLSGTGDTLGNLRTTKASFIDPAAFNYRLLAGSAAIDKGVDLGSANGFSLSPVFQYVEKNNGEGRSSVGKLDVGAFEFGSGNGIRKTGQTHPYFENHFYWFNLLGQSSNDLPTKWDKFYYN